MSFDMTTLDFEHVTLVAANNGPRAATNLKFTTTATPGAAYGNGSCQLLCGTNTYLQQLTSGASS